jgi:outer membrane protein TolC
MFLDGLFLAATAASSAPPLTVQEAASLAASSAPAVTRSSAESARAHAAAAGARSRLWPSLSADLGATTTDDPVGVFALTLQQERFSLAEFAASDPNHPGYLKDFSAGVGLGWDIDLFGSSRGEAQSAAGAAEAAERSARWTGRVAALQAVSAFAAAYRAQTSLRLLAERKSDAVRDASIAEDLFAQGVTTAADPARAKAAIAEVQAQAAEQRAAMEQARASLTALIGEEAGARPLAPLPAPGPRAEPAIGARDDIAAAELSARAAGDRERAASRSRWPSLRVQGVYQLHAPTPGGRWGDFATAFAGFRIPLFASGGIDARVAEARASSRAAEAAAREARQEGDRQVVSARAALEAARAREEAFAEAERAASRAREIQQARYEEGIARLSDLLEARAAELRARIGVASARSERVVAEASLRLALGLSPVEEEPS